MTQEVIVILDQYVASHQNKIIREKKKTQVIRKMQSLHQYFSGIDKKDIVSMIRKDRDL
jgi:hypothetical protein